MLFSFLDKCPISLTERTETGQADPPVALGSEMEGAIEAVAT